MIVLWSASAHAELRMIGVRVTRDTNSKVHVSIASDEAKEKKDDITFRCTKCGFLESYARE